MTIAIISIIILTSIIWLIKKKLKFEVCPICAGVTFTWLWMFVGLLLGKLSVINYQLPTALLMGGTVVGLMSKLEQSIKQKFVLIWKAIFVVSGFITAYSLISENYLLVVLGIIMNTILTVAFQTPKGGLETLQQQKIPEEKMKNCC